VTVVPTSSLGFMTSPAAAACSSRKAVLVIPLGATEQHGPHLPLGTDTDIATALCERLAGARDVVIAPAVPYGSSGEHAGFAGTLSIGQAGLELLVLELVRSATDTFDRVLLVNGHGGNCVALERAIRTLRFEGRDVLSWSPRWEGDPHAGRPETAIELALHSERVDAARMEAGDARPLAELLPLLRDGGMRAVSSNGVLGDPTRASAAEGRALLDALAADLIARLDEWTVAA
jgi:creatinine amidohydrolase